MVSSATEGSKYTIGMLAQRTGIPDTTIRYYVVRGIINPSGRAKNNYKLFDDASLFKLMRIQEIKKNFPEMSLDDIVKEIKEVEGL